MKLIDFTKKRYHKQAQMKKVVSMPMRFRERSGFTLLEVMTSAALVAVAVAGLV